MSDMEFEQMQLAEGAADASDGAALPTARRDVLAWLRAVRRRRPAS